MRRDRRDERAMGSILPLRSPVEDGQHRGPRLVGIDDEAADEVFAALSSATARAILGTLYEQPGTVSDLARAADTSLQNVRYHLDKLESAGLIEVVDTWYSERGTEMPVYAPADDSLVVFAGEEEDHSLRAALSSLLGGVGLLAIVALVLDRLARTFRLESLFDADPSVDPPGTEMPPAGTTGAPSGIAEPTTGTTPAPTVVAPGERSPTTAVGDSTTDAVRATADVTASPGGPTPTAPGRSAAGSTAEATRIERATPRPDGGTGDAVTAIPDSATARPMSTPDRDAGAATPVPEDPIAQASATPDATAASGSARPGDGSDGAAAIDDGGGVTETGQSPERTPDRAITDGDPAGPRQGEPVDDGDGASAGGDEMVSEEPSTTDGQQPQQATDGTTGDGETPAGDGATPADDTAIVSNEGARARTETSAATTSSAERTATAGRETGTDGRAPETTGTSSATETPPGTTAESTRTTTTEAGTTTAAPNGTATETTARGAGTTHAAGANATPTATTAANTTTANTTTADAANGTAADAAANATAIPTGPPTPIESSVFPGSLGHGHDPFARALDATAVHATTGRTVDVLPLPADATVLAGALVLVSIVFRVLVLTWLCSRPCRGAVGYGAAVSHLAATCAEWLRISLLYRTYGRQARLRGVLGRGSSSAARGRAIQKSH
ncbi:hypothetical protein BRC90_09375 [Halobacteriales archaeon QS_4_69_34]|nr:MAG: hypothetical protein BRC90_09375 [Halobacteriales archaeon QS_4_69_34]